MPRLFNHTCGTGKLCKYTCAVPCLATNVSAGFCTVWTILDVSPCFLDRTAPWRHWVIVSYGEASELSASLMGAGKLGGGDGKGWAINPFIVRIVWCAGVTNSFYRYKSPFSARTQTAAHCTFPPLHYPILRSCHTWSETLWEKQLLNFPSLVFRPDLVALQGSRCGSWQVPVSRMENLTFPLNSLPGSHARITYWRFVTKEQFVFRIGVTIVTWTELHLILPKVSLP